VTRPFATRSLQFYLTAPAACPYLPDRDERKVFTHIDGADGEALNDALTQAGFRRSQSIVYRPACENCDACLSARVVADAFTPSKSQQRAINRNRALTRETRPPAATDEQFALLRRYLESRHAEGGMTEMTFGDYAMMVADTPARTRITEYRDAERTLVAAALVDELSDGLSLVYSFFDPSLERRSLGSFVIVDHIRQANDAALPFVYLGYWVKDSPKMGYKKRFGPLEVLRPGGWTRLESDGA
jgi:arginine-tRNA-protein transferase